MRQLENYCKNCGANIENTDQFCPDCGKEIPTNRQTIRYCHNCGEKIASSENFCKNCGTQIKASEKEKTGFWKSFKIPIIILAVIVVISLLSMSLLYLSTTYESQDVNVDTLNFNIPENFIQDDNMAVDEVEDGVRYVSKCWNSTSDYIEIDVMYAADDNDVADEVARQMGGERKTMMGYDGYYNELSDAYAFSLVKDNKLVIIYTSDYNLFDEIEVL